MGEILPIRDFDEPTYNPFTALKELAGEGDVQNFYPELKRLRDLGPVLDGEIRAHFGLKGDLTMAHLRHVAVLGHAEVKDVLSRPQLYSNRVYSNNIGVFFGDSITVMDNPEHGRYRRFFQKAFMPKMIAAWGDEIIPRLINRLIDGFEARGQAELVSEFTLHFPFHFIHELMGLPIEARPVFHKLAFGQIALTFDYEHGLEAALKLKEYLTDVVHERRDHPRPDDFMSTMATAEIDGERLPDNIIISFFRQLMNAGGDTSFNGFSTVLAALLRHPEQFEAIKQDRTLVPKAIEEGLRWNCPVPGISRTPTEPVELGGVRINPGDHMMVMLAAANRDERAFPDPDAFNINRGARSHLAFGYGSHICIGQYLAKLEMVNAMNALLDRLPKLRIDPEKPAPVISGLSLRGPQHLYVRFD